MFLATVDPRDGFFGCVFVWLLLQGGHSDGGSLRERGVKMWKHPGDVSHIKSCGGDSAVPLWGTPLVSLQEKGLFWEGSWSMPGVLQL